jgi:hypothetical protein
MDEICAQPSKSAGLPRTYSMPLIELDPPSVLPRGQWMRRPPLPSPPSAL